MGKRKALIVSTVSRQFYLFEQVNIALLNSLGYEVHCAADFSDSSTRLNELFIQRHNIVIKRSPLSFRNIIGLFQLISLIKKNQYELIHCHSPVGGVIARLAAFFTLSNSKVIYTAHGFHFYSGAPLLNWVFFFPTEIILSYLTNTVITINREDYKRARFFFGCKVLYCPGIGINVTKFNSNSGIPDIKQEYGLPNNAKIILMVGELIPRKNYITALKSFAEVIKSKTNVYLLICGKGIQYDYLRKFVEENYLSSKVFFLGFRDDVNKLYSVSDIFFFPSYQEGLPVSLMEAMASGLPVVCSNIRGNIDLIEDSRGGYIKKPNDIEGFVNALNTLLSNESLCKRMANYNKKEIENFSSDKVKIIMNELYSNFLHN